MERNFSALGTVASVQGSGETLSFCKTFRGRRSSKCWNLVNLGDELLIIQANQANLLNCQSISLSSSFLSLLYWYIGVWSFALNLGYRFWSSPFIFPPHWNFVSVWILIGQTAYRRDQTTCNLLIIDSPPSHFDYRDAWLDGLACVAMCHWIQVHKYLFATRT